VGDEATAGHPGTKRGVTRHALSHPWRFKTPRDPLLRIVEWQGDDLSPVHGQIEAHDLDRSQRRVTGGGKANIGYTMFKEGGPA